jgi:hypothetical protein
MRNVLVGISSWTERTLTKEGDFYPPGRRWRGLGSSSTPASFRSDRGDGLNLLLPCIGHKNLGLGP